MDAAANRLSFTLSPGMAPVAPLMRLLSRFDREKVEAFAEISIALLDLMEPPSEDDPDFRAVPDGMPGDAADAEDDDPREDDDEDAEHDGREAEDGF